MEGLNRQAKKAERYQKIQDRVRQLDILVHLEMYVRLSGEIDETDTLLISIKDEDLAHSTQLKKLDAAVENIKLERSEKSNEIAKQKNTRYDIQRRLDTLENDMAHLRRQIAQREKEIKDFGIGKNRVGRKKSPYRR
jgi:chromosome segregation protein